MPDASFIILKQATTEVEAHAIQSLLEDHGFPVVLSPRRRSNLDGTLAAGPWDICVVAEDAADAQALIEDHAETVPEIDWDQIDVGEPEDPDPERTEEDLTLPGIAKLLWLVIVAVSVLSVLFTVLKVPLPKFP